MGNILGCATKELKPLMADEETTSINNTCTAEIVKNYSEIPEDLVFEILCKLPVKPLIRFKTVCKAWKLLIESPVFIDMHLRRPNPRVEAVRPVWKGEIVGACNGIICFKPRSPENSLILWNPAIREFSFIPQEFDGNFFSFCYLPKTQEYLIISFNVELFSNKLSMMILTLGKTKSLRYVEDVIVPGWITQLKHATTGTTVAWLGIDAGDFSRKIVICYDAIEERFSKIDMHPSHYPCRSLSVLNDSVILFVCPRENPTFFDIWILIDDVFKGRSWRKYRRIEQLEAHTTIRPLSVGWYDRSILCLKSTIGTEYEKNFEFYYDPQTDQYWDPYTTLFYYDLQTDQVQDQEETDALTLEFANYVESLVSIKSLGLDTTYY